MGRLSMPLEAVQKQTELTYWLTQQKIPASKSTQVSLEKTGVPRRLWAIALTQISPVNIDFRFQKEFLRASIQ